MAYTKQSFENGQVLTAAHLNHMEDGIENAVSCLSQTLTEAQKAQARVNIGAAKAVVSDKDLFENPYTLTLSDYIHGLWNGELDAGSDTPYFGEEVGDQFCTRKFVTNQLPKITYSYFTTPVEYVFWNNGVYAGKVTWAEIEETGSAGFAFDEVSVNFSWGWSYVGTETIVTMKYANPGFEKVLVIGDSISTDYYGSYTKWVTRLLEDGFFPESTVNDSIHATGFVAKYTGESSGATNDFLNRIVAVTDKDTFDLVVVFGGINDYIQNIPMGESGGDRTANFKPAVDWFFDYLVNNFTQARLVVLSPLRTYQNWVNPQGHTETEYAEYIRTVAKSYCLPVLNLTEESGFVPFNDTFKNMWTLVPSGYTNADGVHPNEEYQRKFLAPMIKNFLSKFV